MGRVILDDSEYDSQASSSSESSGDLAPEGDPSVYDSDGNKVCKSVPDEESVTSFSEEEEEEKPPPPTLHHEDYTYYCRACEGFRPTKWFSREGANKGWCSLCGPEKKWRVTHPQLVYPAKRLMGQDSNRSGVYKRGWYWCKHCPGFCSSFSGNDTIYTGRCTAHSTSSDFGRKQQRPEDGKKKWWRGEEEEEELR